MPTYSGVHRCHRSFGVLFPTQIRLLHGKSIVHIEGMSYAIKYIRGRQKTKIWWKRKELCERVREREESVMFIFVIKKT